MTRNGLKVVRSIREIFDGDHEVITIDMPIGLPLVGPRQSEREARRYLSPRGSTIFPTPPRACLAATDYRQACEISHATRGVKLSKQSWHILPKIAELDRALDPADDHRVVEAHPECSFAAMNGDRPLPSKHTSIGLVERTNLIRQWLGVEPARVHGAGHDDVLDAYALLWTAERFQRGEHRTFPAGAIERDERGLAMRIVR